MTKVRRTQLQRREESEEKLLEAAISLIARKGLDALTLAEVGELAGYSRGLPVHYFETKEGLIGAVVRRLIGKSLQYTRQTAKDLRGLDQIEDHYVGHIRRLDAENPDSRALYALYLASLFNPQIAGMMREYHQAMLDLTMEKLREAVALEQIRPDTDIESEARSLVTYRRGVALLTLTDVTTDITLDLKRFLDNIRTRLAPVR